MKNIDTSVFVAEEKKVSRIKPDEVDFSDLPPIPKPQPQEEQKIDTAPLERKSERTEFRTVFRSAYKPILAHPKRRTTRYSFQFYEDQIVRLKQLKHQAEMNGEKVTLSDFAREALDRYLSRKEK